MPDDGLRGGTDHQRLLQLLSAPMGHHRKLRRKALDVFSFLLDEAVRDEHGEVGVSVAGLLEPSIEGALDVLPQGVSIGANRHTPPHGSVIG